MLLQWAALNCQTRLDLSCAVCAWRFMLRFSLLLIFLPGVWRENFPTISKKRLQRPVASHNLCSFHFPPFSRWLFTVRAKDFFRSPTKKWTIFYCRSFGITHVATHLWNESFFLSGCTPSRSTNWIGMIRDFLFDFDVFSLSPND